MKYSFKRKIAIVISILLVLICGILSKTYRPYIYENNIYDFHLADTLTSWFSVPAASLMGWGLFHKHSFPKYIMVSVLAFIIYEFLFTLTFDYYDIIALFPSGFITYIIYRFYHFCPKLIQIKYEK